MPMLDGGREAQARRVRERESLQRRACLPGSSELSREQPAGASALKLQTANHARRGRHHDLDHDGGGNDDDDSDNGSDGSHRGGGHSHLHVDNRSAPLDGISSGGLAHPHQGNEHGQAAFNRLNHLKRSDFSGYIN
eukprot:5475245-Prymnesium_polylepis.1